MFSRVFEERAGLWRGCEKFGEEDEHDGIVRLGHAEIASEHLAIEGAVEDAAIGVWGAQRTVLFNNIVDLERC